MVRKIRPQEIEAVPDDAVDEIYNLWFDTCVPDEIKETSRGEKVVYSNRFAARMMIAEWGLDNARKIVMALPLSPDHNGSRHRDENGNRVVRNDLRQASRDGGNLIDFWDSRR